MKRFLQKSYSWLATLLLTVAFAVSGNVAAATVTLPLNNGGGTVDGVSYTYGSCDWAGKANIYSDFTAAAGWGYITIACYTENIVKVELTTTGDAGTVYEYNHNGSVTTNGNVVVWEGSAQELGFTSSADVYITNIVVYTEAGGGEVVTTSTEMPLNNGAGSVDGISYTYGSCDWAGKANIYSDFTAADGWGYITLSCFDKDIVKVELTTTGDAGTVYEYNHNGEVTTDGNIVVWTGSAHELGFTSSADVYINKIVVYTESNGAIVKDCSIDVDHFAENCKPGKVESISKWITLYMQANTLATGWTGGHNCPEGVTFTTEAGEEIPVDQFNYWAGSDQIGVNLYEEITTPGVYTLHIPEGLVAFEGGKFNKEINATWTVVEPDNRPTKDVVFDYTVADFATNVDGVAFETTASYFSNAEAIRVKQGEALTFTAPEKASIVKVVLVNDTEKGNQPADFVANVGDIYYSGYNINWEGDATSLVITSNYDMSVYFTKAIVTLAVEESEQPEVDPAETAFFAWKALVMNEMKAVKDEWVDYPEVDVPGKKPAAVVKAVMEYYQNTSWLFSSFSGFGDDWAAAKAYYANYGTTIEANYAEALQIWQLYLDAELVPEAVDPIVPDTPELVATGCAPMYIVGSDFEEVAESHYVNYEKYSNNTIVFKNFLETGYDVNVAYTNADPYYGEGYKEIYLTSEGGVRTEYGFAFNNGANLHGEDFSYMDDTFPYSFYFNGDLSGTFVDELCINYWSYVGYDWRYIVIDFTQNYVAPGPEVTTTFKGEVTPNLTSVSSLADLEGIELTFVDADQVSVLEEGGDGIYVQNENGSEFYAIWHPGFGGTYEVNGNVVTLRNFFSDNTDGYFNELPAGKAVLYFEDYGTFDVNNADADWDGYINTFSVAYEGAPVAQPFELAFRNNMVVCENGQKVEANEAGVGADFYLVNEGLTAIGKTATLYKDGNAMSFIMTLVDGTAISFLGGSSLITEPGTYLLEVPEGTYVDAAGNPSIAYYGQWVIIQKDEPAYTEPVLKAEDVTAEVAYYIYTDARGGLTVESADATRLVGTSEAGINQTVDPTDVRQQFAFVNWEGNLYLYSIATEKFIGKSNRGTFTDEPVDPIYFKNEGNGTVMLYFDDSFNINLGGSKQVTIDTWKQKDAGNSFKIMVAAPFDQTEIFEKLAGWNGNILYPETASNLDDLLSYTVEFENAKEVEASGYDVLAAIFDANGDPYAIALANGVFDSFGSVSFDGGKATVNFMKISDLTAAAQTSAKAAAARIGGFIQPEGQASVVFAGKSFKVDGELVYDVLQKNYDLGENGVPTGIDTIATESNDSIYDLNGRRVNSVRSGLYIKNGVKVFMK